MGNAPVVNLGAAKQAKGGFGGAVVTPTLRQTYLSDASRPSSAAAEAASPPADAKAAADGGAEQRRGAHVQLMTTARREGQRFRNLVQRPILLGAIGLHLLGIASIFVRLGFANFSLDIFFVSFTCSALATAAGLPALDWQNARRTIHVMLGSCVVICFLHAYILAAYVRMAAAAALGGGSCAVAETSAPAQPAPCAWAFASVALLAMQTLRFGWMILHSYLHLFGNAPEHSLAHLFTRSVGRAMRAFGACALARVAVGVAYGLFAPTMMWLALLLSGCSGLLFGQLMVTTRYVAFVRGLFAERGDGVSTAASIAAIIKGSHAASVPALARQHFRGVRICDLTLDALSGNAADANANAISRHANLGEVDAFVTHSWSDDAAAKLRALRGWRAQFMALNRREPLVWIDKFCLDQLEIEDGLACLPVFLAGCDSLLVLAGPTWGQRLWCATEMYVHFEIGRCEDAIELVDLCAPPRPRRPPAQCRSSSGPAQRIVRRRECTVAYGDPDGEGELPAPSTTGGSGMHRTASVRPVAPQPPRQPAPLGLHLAREQTLSVRSLPPRMRFRASSTARSDRESELALEDVPALDDEADESTGCRHDGEMTAPRGEASGRRRDGAAGRSGAYDLGADLPLAQLIEAFDVRRAQCTDSQTSAQLMRVIEAGSHSLEHFNEQMRTTLHRAHARATATLLRSKDDSSEWNRSFRSRTSTRRMPTAARLASTESTPSHIAAAPGISRTRAVSSLEPRRSKLAIATWTEDGIGGNGRVFERSHQAEGMHACGSSEV